jgi:chitinase
MSTYLDWFGVMAYDRCGASASETCHHALYDPPASPTLTGHEAMQMYLDGGAKPGQLVLGIPFYGYKWTVDSSDMNSSHGIGETTTGSSRKAGGEIPYRDVKSKYLGHTGYQYYWDASAHESVIFNNDTSEVISFDDENSIALKAKVVRDSGLGGIMIWDITTDDDQGTLLGAVNRP